MPVMSALHMRDSKCGAVGLGRGAGEDVMLEGEGLGKHLGMYQSLWMFEEHPTPFFLCVLAFRRFCPLQKSPSFRITLLCALDWLLQVSRNET